MSEEKKLKARVAHKHKTEADWYLDVYTAADSTTKRSDPFIPLDGELIIFDKDSNHEKRFKFGDGKTDIIALPFAGTNLDEIKDEAKKTGTKGLAYELSEDKTYYICTGIGDCEETEIVIASEIGELPVTEIDPYAFDGNTYITKIVIPNSVTTIRSRAF
jgi:hypothetical protein